MHILISALSYPTPHLQITAFLPVLAKEMVRQGHEVTVIAPQSLTTCYRHKTPLSPQKYIEEFDNDGSVGRITVFRPYSITFGMGRFFHYSQLIDKFIVNRTARKIRNKPDVVYSHFWWSASNIIDYAVSNNLPLFVASGEDIIDIDNIEKASVIQYIKRNTRGVICVSSKNKEESIEHGLTNGDNTIVLPNAVNRKEFSKLNKDKERRKHGFNSEDFIVAFCGRFDRRKGSKRLSDALESLKEYHIKSIFIGYSSGDNSEEPICDGIIFKGKLIHSEISSYLNCADVFVLPTLAEGCSNSIVEAMSCGLPIISSDLPFNKDILNKNNSVLINPMDVNEIAGAIKYIYDNPEKRNEMSEASLQMAKDLTIDKRVSRIMDFIKKCI